MKESEYVNWAKMTWAIAGDSFHVHFKLRSFLCTVFIEVVFLCIIRECLCDMTLCRLVIC